MPTIVPRQFELNYGLDQIDSSPAQNPKLPSSDTLTSPTPVTSETDNLWHVGIKEEGIMSAISRRMKSTLGNPKAEWFHGKLGAVSDELRKLRLNTIDPETLRAADKTQKVVDEQAGMGELAWKYQSALISD